MDQNLNSGHNDFLWTLLANPAGDVQTYNFNLQRLVNDFPQSGLLQALLAHSSEEKNLRQASVYFNARALYKLINAPATFNGVDTGKIIINGKLPAGSFVTAPFEDYGTENFFSDPSAIAAEEPAESFAGNLLQADHTHWQMIGEDDYARETPAEEIYHEVPEHNEPPAVAEETPTAETTDGHEGPAGQLHQPDQQETSAPDLHHEEHVIPSTEEHEANLQESYAEIGDVANEKETPVTEFEEAVKEESPAITEEVTDDHHEEVTNDNHHDIAAETAPEQEAASVEDLTAEHQEPQVEAIVEHPATDETARAPAGPETATPEEEPAVTKDEPAETIAGQAETPVVAAHSDTATQPEHEAEKVPEEKEKPVLPLAETKETHFETKPVNNSIDDEIYDEIVGIENIDIEGEILSNIAANDYFMFDNAFAKDAPPDTKEADTPVAEEEYLAPQAAITGLQDADQQDLSKYHDEQMPYTFMWWLDKTRKEHAGIYQPYAKSEPAPPAEQKAESDELQQQYYENIFHLTTIDELNKNVQRGPVNFKPTRKEDVIIERFIQEEPQIRPQSSDKLDNENKAKKSSEDRDELVTETLAAIYSDQMLFHKAIASYKKLMLKFPEKSRYFAAKIEQLEKKTN